MAEGPTSARTARREQRMRVSLVVADAFAAAAVTALAAPSAGIPTLLGVVAVLAITLKLFGLYDADVAVMRRSTLDDVLPIAAATAIALLVSWLLLPSLAPEASRLQVLAGWVALAAALVVGRAAARSAVRTTTPPERCLVVGTNGAVHRLTGRLESGRASVAVVATIPVAPGGKLPDGLATVEALSDLRRIYQLERLVIAPFDGEGFDALDLVRIAKATGLRVSMLPRTIEVVGSSMQVEDVDGLPMLGVRPLGLSWTSRAMKRALDITGALLGLLAVAPVMAIVAAAVKLDSSGPVFFRQPRVGREGEHFGMLKFRSMGVDADAMKDALRDQNETDGLFKLTHDPRVTRVGRLLRSTSLDELPQLLNVLRGEMSLVGPRPLVVEEDALVAGLDRARLHLTPGMTGPWQVLGGTRVPLSEMVAMDYLYVANWSLWRDLEILARTVLHVVRRGGV